MSAETVRYATLAGARAEIKAGDDDTSGDAYLLEALRFASARITRHAGYTFAPYRGARYFGAGDVDDYEGLLLLGEPLLAAETVTVGGVAWTYGTDYLEYPRGAWHTLQLRALTRPWTSALDSGAHDPIAVTGLWGYHSAYTAAGWVPSGDALLEGVGTDTVTLAVSDIAGADAWGRAPRFSPGALLRLGDELVEALAADAGTNTLTVRRACRGTLAAAHDAGTPPLLWAPELDITRAALRWADYLYQRRGAFTRVEFDGVATVQFPDDLPGEVAGILAPYAAAAAAALMMAV